MPLRLAQQGTHLQGTLAVERLPRLRAALLHGDGVVALDWQFSLDAAQRPVLQGRLQSVVALECQRCLQAVDYTLDLHLQLLILRPGVQKTEVAEGWETFELSDTEPLSLYDWVEDELLLALPLIARHAQCPNNLYQSTEQGEPPLQDEPRENPFAVLAKLKGLP